MALDLLGPTSVSPLLILCLSAPLTLEEAVDRALQTAPELAARAEQERAAEARAHQVFSGYLPQANVNISYRARSPKNELPIELPPLPGLEPVGDIDDIHHFAAGLTVGLRVLDFSRDALHDAAEARREAEQYETDAVRARLAFQTRATFLAALLARDVHRIAKESLAVAREEERRAVLRAEVGTGSQVALAQARVRVASLVAQSRRAESELARHQSKLGTLIRSDRLPELGGNLEALAAPGRGRDLESSPELRALAAQRRAALEAETAQDYRLIPTLSAQGGIELIYPRALQLELGPVYSFSVMLSWAAFDGLRSASAADEAEAQAAALAQMSTATRDRLHRELIDLEARARTARADLESADETLEQTKIYLRVAKAAVEAGTGTALDVHNAELGIDQAKTARERALFELALVKAQTLMVYGVAKES